MLLQKIEGSCGTERAGVFECIGRSVKPVEGLNLEDMAPSWYWDAQEWATKFPSEAVGVVSTFPGQRLYGPALLSEIATALATKYPSDDLRLWVYACPVTTPGRSFMHAVDNTGNNCLQKWQEVGGTMPYDPKGQFFTDALDHARSLSMATNKTIKFNHKRPTQFKKTIRKLAYKRPYKGKDRKAMMSVRRALQARSNRSATGGKPRWRKNNRRSRRSMSLSSTKRKAYKRYRAKRRSRY